MGFQGLKVSLINPRAVYYSGQTLQGTVRVTVSSETSCRGITVTMIGKGKVRWTERRNKKTHSYTANEEYGKTSLTLWHGAASGNKICSGDHTFPFVFEIPNCIPSSVATAYGQIYYKVKAVADIPWGIDIDDKVPFVVHHVVDLNAISDAQLPLVVRHEDDPGWFSNCSVSFDMYSDQSGYVPHEKLLINGTIRNCSQSSLEYTEAKIVQKLTYFATSKSREVETTVQRVYRPKLRAGEKDIWSGVSLTVPDVIASGLQYCGIMDVEYILKFIAKFGMLNKAEARAKLIIGSVPLQRHSSANPSPRSTGSVPRDTGIFQHNILPYPAGRSYLNLSPRSTRSLPRDTGISQPNILAYPARHLYPNPSPRSTRSLPRDRTLQPNISPYPAGHSYPNPSPRSTSMPRDTGILQPNAFPSPTMPSAPLLTFDPRRDQPPSAPLLPFDPSQDQPPPYSEQDPPSYEEACDLKNKQ